MKIQLYHSKSVFASSNALDTYLMLKDYQNLLRVCRDHLPKELRHIKTNIYITDMPIQLNDLDNKDLVAKCYDDCILFICRELPDQKSLFWLLTHELCHFITKSPDNKGNLDLMEELACLKQEELGISWNNDFCYASTYYLNRHLVNKQN